MATFALDHSSLQENVKYAYYKTSDTQPKLGCVAKIRFNCGCKIDIFI